MREIIDARSRSGPLFLVTLTAFLLMVVVGSAITAMLLSVGEVDLWGSGSGNWTVTQRNWLRISLLLNNLLLFGGTAFLALFYVYRGEWTRQVGFSTGPVTGTFWWSSAFFVLSVPLVAYLAYWNLQLELPDWALRNEESTNKMLGGILTMTSVPELFLALLTVGVTPALGEELLLRGVLQRRLLQPVLGNHHLAIWIAAAVFSAMHLEFGGFLPRLGLGVSLGYAYYWSRSLWVPILLHFLFNASQVLVTYWNGAFVPDTEVGTLPPWWLLVLAIPAMIYVWWQMEVRMRLSGPK